MSKNWLLLVVVMITVFSMVMVGLPEAFANSITLPFEHKSVEHLPKLGLTEITVGAERVTVGEGVGGFKKLVNVTSGFLGLILGTIALIMLLYAGYQLVSAQGEVSDQLSKTKMNVVYILLGLVVFALSGDFVYNFLFRDEGAFLLDQTAALGLATETVDQIRRLLNLFLSFSGAGAILMLVIASMKLIVNPGSDEQIEKQKKLVGYTAVGIIIIGLADTLVNRIVFREGGYKPVDVSAFERQLEGLSNYILGFLGVAIFATIVISGVIMVIHFGNDDMITKVKTNMRNVLIGSVVAYSAYTIVATVLRTFLAA